VAPFPIGFSLSLIYAGDVADAIARCLERPATTGRVYNLAGAPLTVWDFLRAWRIAGGRVPRLLVPLPLPLRQNFDSRRAGAEIGWRPRPIADGLADMFRREHTTGGAK
jgi:nucleoside-diphosphate-sugar epimerase